MIISVPVHTAECSTRPVGAFTVLVAVQRSSRQVGGTGVGMGVGVGVGLKGVGVGVGVELGVGVGVGVGPGTCTSNAPISTVPLKTRLKPGPRWSVVKGLPFWSTAKALLPASIAGLPGKRA